MYYFDSPSDNTSYIFDKYYGFQLLRRAIAWTLCQIYTCGCMAGVIKMAVKYYGGWTELWIVNFLIFTVFDWAALEIIYSIAA